MKTFWLLLLVFQNVRAGMLTWDFGADKEGFTVIALKSGDIGLKKKLTQVSLPVPPCMNVKYVRVEIQNLVTTPAVSYNRDTHTVTIAYNLLSLSTWSHYDIMAKGKMKKSCGGGPATRFPNQHQEPGSQYGHPPNGGHYDINGQYKQPHQYPNYDGSGKYPNYGGNDQYPNYGGNDHYPNYGGDGNYPDDGNQENYPDNGNQENYPDYGDQENYPDYEPVRPYTPQDGINEHDYDPNPIKVPTEHLPSTRFPSQQSTQNPTHPQYHPDKDIISIYPPDDFVLPERIVEEPYDLPPADGGYYYNPTGPNIHIDDSNPSSIPVDDLDLNMNSNE